MGLLSRRPKHTASQPSWVAPTPVGPVHFDPALRTAADLVGAPLADELPAVAPQPQRDPAQPAHIVAA